MVSLLLIAQAREPIAVRERVDGSWSDDNAIREPLAVILFIRLFECVRGNLGCRKMSNDLARQRPGEVALDFDPASREADASLVFIGRLQTPWPSRSDCPKNLRQARERGGGAAIVLDPEWRAGLTELTPGGHAIVLYWMDEARRDLIIQKPRHRETAAGVFAIRSPVRPNPIGFAVVHIMEIDQSAGRIEIDAIDARNGTPVIDIKPWLQGVDVPPGQIQK